MKMTQDLNIADLIPYETTFTSAKLNKAKKNLKRGKKFTSPVKVFKLKEHWFVRDGTHRVMAAKERGDTKIQCVETNPPDDWKELVKNMEDYLSRQGFRNLNQASGLSDRAKRNQKIDKDQLLKDLGK
jgi:ParB-like chromosome segregation protein Spo0J